MSTNKNSILLVILMTITGLALFGAPSVGAFSLPDILGGVKNFFQPTPAPQALPKNDLTLDSDIQLAKDGDLNGNGQIDAGDTLIFRYTIANTTNNNYSFVTLETNIPREKLHYIHNIRGTANLSDDTKSILIPNLSVAPGQILNISFEGVIDFFQDSDQSISTEPKLIDSKKQLLRQSLKREVNSKALKNADIQSMVKKVNK